MKRFVLYTHFYSPHELPLFRACSQVFDDAWYVVDQAWRGDPSRKGWSPDLSGLQSIVLGEVPESERTRRLVELLDESTVVMYGTRGNPYEKCIYDSPAVIVYASERWLKPYGILPGWLHWFQPSFFRRVRSLRKWLESNPRAYYFGIGIHAVRDMVCLLKKGPCDGVDKAPLGCARVKAGAVEQIRLWGYFVQPGERIPTNQERRSLKPDAVSVLWVGRMLGWKRVDTLVRAIAACKGMPRISLTVVGQGPEKVRIVSLARRLGVEVQFMDFVPMDGIRKIMKKHDIYVLPSNDYEGWGAVVNEALEEGMIVLGTRSAGAAVTMLPEDCLFETGDWRSLAHKLQSVRMRPGIGQWTPWEAACRLRNFADAVVPLPSLKL